jgi:Na+/H+-translocating membrane pyrophosphatase
LDGVAAFLIDSSTLTRLTLIIQEADQIENLFGLSSNEGRSGALLAVASFVVLRLVSTSAAVALLVALPFQAGGGCAHVVNRLAPLTVRSSAQDQGPAAYIVLSAATVCGLIPASWVLISLSFGYFLILRGVVEPVDLAGFVLGAAAVSLFFRLAGECSAIG